MLLRGIRWPRAQGRHWRRLVCLGPRLKPAVRLFARSLTLAFQATFADNPDKVTPNADPQQLSRDEVDACKRLLAKVEVPSPETARPHRCITCMLMTREVPNILMREGPSHARPPAPTYFPLCARKLSAKARRAPSPQHAMNKKPSQGEAAGTAYAPCERGPRVYALRCKELRRKCSGKHGLQNASPRLLRRSSNVVKCGST